MTEHKFSECDQFGYTLRSNPDGIVNKECPICLEWQIKCLRETGE